jgi:hypothetical protein
VVVILTAAAIAVYLLRSRTNGASGAARAAGKDAAGSAPGANGTGTDPDANI